MSSAVWSLVTKPALTALLLIGPARARGRALFAHRNARFWINACGCFQLKRRARRIDSQRIRIRSAYTTCSHASFSGVYDPCSCTCDAISNRNVGRGHNGVCWKHPQLTRTKMKKAASQLQLGNINVHSRWFNYACEAPCILDGTCHSTPKKGQREGGVVDDTC